jgi:NAD(P)-dependent dehydrogenase (short-subunit alcohol dehydrogenase family)
MTDEFDGMTVIVTGGGSGIGFAIAKAFVAAGARVGVLDKDPRGAPADATALAVDVTNDAEVTSAVNELCPDGRVDVLVNNAGVSYPATVEEGPLSDWRDVYDVNVLGMVRTTRAALPFLRRSAAPSILNMSSCTATIGLRNRVLYAGTKGAIEAMSRAMAADLIGEGIRVNCLAPGTVDTPLISALIDQAPDPAAQRAVYDARQPTGTMVRANEIADAALFISRPSARSIVGAVLAVDGGLTSIKVFAS